MGSRQFIHIKQKGISKSRKNIPTSCFITSLPIRIGNIPIFKYRSFSDKHIIIIRINKLRRTNTISKNNIGEFIAFKN
ncbi:hypothetical protein DD581_35315 [Klebsiella pneumoniae]|nr:hypothetical protein DD581_35315 [Klebsiella pneumoniae]